MQTRPRWVDNEPAFTESLWQETLLQGVTKDLYPLIYFYYRKGLPTLNQNLSFQLSFGTQGSQTNEFKSPYGVAIDPVTGDYVIADT